MNKEKISVIIPIYNAEKCLKKCLDSVINQTYKNLEIILINDGSKDNSLKMIGEYNDPRIKLINKENGGVSSARNRGILEATGKYVIFIDADDYIENNMLEALEKDLFQNNVDLAMCGYRKVDINGNTLFESQPTKERYFDARQFKTYLFQSKYFNNLICNKIFKLEIIKNNNIKFNEDIHINENVLFLLDFSRFAFRYSYFNEILYNFFDNREGATNSKFNIKKVSVLSSYIRLLNYDLDQNILNKVKYKYLFEGYLYNYLMKKNNIDNKPLETNLIKFKKTYLNDVKSEETISNKDKHKLWLMMHFNSFYAKKYAK